MNPEYVKRILALAVGSASGILVRRASVRSFGRSDGASTGAHIAIGGVAALVAIGVVIWVLDALA